MCFTTKCKYDFFYHSYTKVTLKHHMKAFIGVAILQIVINKLSLVEKKRNSSILLLKTFVILDQFNTNFNVIHIPCYLSM